MKSIDWLTLTRLKMSRVLGIAALVVFAFACSDGSDDVTPSADASARKNAKLNANDETPNGNCESKKEDYVIVVENTGACWKYTITKQAGAKDLSHFIIDLNNCPDPERTPLSIERFYAAKVNGVNWNLSSSEGNGTGCVVSNNIVKFDNLPSAQVYVLEFCLNPVYHNFLPTTVWIKAGCTCNAWVEEIPGPCCAL